VSNEAGLSALCKVVAPAQVQVTYCAADPLPFRVEWSADLGPISFAGPTPDEAAERALSALGARGSQCAPKVAPSATEPSATEGFAEAMRERIRQIEERGQVRKPNLRLVR
jgi:hypothetical protein